MKSIRIKNQDLTKLKRELEQTKTRIKTRTRIHRTTKCYTYINSD